MGRHLEFDIDLAKQAAIKLFWSKGYHAATLDLFCETMAISRSSFYSTFGDKRTLFVECVDMYIDQFTRGMSQIDSLEELKQATIRKFCEGISEKRHRGCMLVSIGAEMADVDDELVRIIRDGMQTVMQTRVKFFLRIGYSLPQAKQLGSFLHIFLEGLLVSSRRRMPAQKIKEIIETGFDLIQPAFELNREVENY